MSGVEHTIHLERGIMLGGRPQTEAVIREPSAGDIIQATREAEQLVMGERGPQLVASPTMVGVHLLCRVIVRIGDIPGPLTLESLSLLSGADLETLQAATEVLEGASLEVASRGRDAQAGAGSDAGTGGRQPGSARLDA